MENKVVNLKKVKVAVIKNVKILAHKQSKGRKGKPKPSTHRITIPQQTMKDNEFLNNDDIYDIVIYRGNFTNEIVKKESVLEGD